MSNKSLHIVHWPKSTPNAMTNDLLNVIRNSEEVYSQDQAQQAAFIRQTLDDKYKGKWTLIICPEDSSSVDVSFTNSLNENGEEMFFDLIKNNKRYLFWKNP